MKVNFIMGYLGSGKTTFIQSYLSSPEGRDEHILLIVNDFGKVNYDAAALRQHGVEVKDITYGCLCCDLRIYFRELLTECARRKDLDRVIIEPSGILIPDIITELFEDHEIAEKLALEPLIHIVDVRLFFRIRGKNWPPFIKKQIAVSEKIVLNRTEELSGEEMEEVLSALQAINLGAKYYHFLMTEGAEPIIAGASGMAACAISFDDEAVSTAHNFKTVQVDEGLDFPDKETLEKFLNSHGGKLARAKGYVKIAGKPYAVSFTPAELNLVAIPDPPSYGISMIFSTVD